MAQDTFKGLIFTFALFSLFAFLMVFAVVELGANYGKDASEIGDGALNDDAFKSSIEGVNTSADNFRSRFEDGDIVDVDNVVGIFSIANDMVSMITAPFLLLAVILSSLKVPIIVITVILGLLGITLLLAVWRLVKQGD